MASPLPTKMTWAEKFCEAKKLKEEGNQKFKDKNVKGALGRYHRSLLYVKGILSADKGVPMAGGETPTEDRIPLEETVNVTRLYIDCHNNLAACLLASEKPDYAKIIKYCDNVLEHENNVKALYRKGVSLFHLGNPEEAMSALLKAKDLPVGQTDPRIQTYITLCEKACAKQDQKLKMTYKAMFSDQKTDADSSDSRDNLSS